MRSALGRRRLTPWLIAVTAAGLAIRFLPGFLALTTSDMEYYLLLWEGFIHEHGAAAYAEVFSNYAPLYTYLMGLVALLPEELWSFGIKLVSICGDVVLAWAAGAVVAAAGWQLPARVSVNLRWATAAAVMWLPTVMMNSAMWGQCDVFWTSCCMLSLWCFLRRRPVAAMLWFGVAVSFKQQAIFFSPVVLVMLLLGRARWWQLVLVPAVYALTCVPCALAGREWESLLNVYVEQRHTSIDWWAHAPSPYLFIRHMPYSPKKALAIMWAVGVFTLVLCIVVARRMRKMNRRDQVRLILVFTAFCGVFYPYVLPMMHERYMYLGDIATLVAAIALWRSRSMWLAALCTQCASGIAVGSILKQKFEVAGVLETAVAFATVALAILAIMLYRSRLNPINPDESR